MLENLMLIASAAICIGILAFGVYIISRYRLQKRHTTEFIAKYGFVQTETDDDFLTETLHKMYWRLSAIDFIPGKMDYKIFAAYKKQHGREFVYMFDVSSERKIIMPAFHPMAEMRYILAKTKRKLEAPFIVHIWSNTYGPGSYVHKSDSVRIKSLDLGQAIRMGTQDAISLTRADEIEDMRPFYFYGPTGGHPEAYMDEGTFELVRRAEENGIAEISHRDGMLLFRIFYLGAGNTTGNLIMNPGIPYEHIKLFLKA